MSNVGIVDGGDYVPEGIYKVAFVDHETLTVFNRPVARFWFRVVSEGQYYESLVVRYYNVRRFKGKAGKNGGFDVSRGQDYYADICRLFDIRPNRTDRIGVNLFKGKLFDAEIAPVATNYKQKKKAEGALYSKVVKLIGEAA